MEPGDFARAIETYLCRRNDGHLIRIAGPAFEQVCGWARRGVPLKVAFQGIDRYADRYDAKGPRRRPIRIEFCEADVLDAFDDWRRAVGVPAAVDDAEERGAQAADDDAGDAARRREPLHTHIARVVARLTALGDGAALPAAIADRVRLIASELDGLSAATRRARGAGRAAVIERLTAVDAELLAALHESLDAGMLAELGGEADLELAPFAGRMPSAALRTARAASLDRLLRRRFSLPRISFE